MPATEYPILDARAAPFIPNFGIRNQFNPTMINRAAEEARIDTC
jgi:hypothetical protein